VSFVPARAGSGALGDQPLQIPREVPVALKAPRMNQIARTQDETRFVTAAVNMLARYHESTEPLAAVTAPGLSGGAALEGCRLDEYVARIVARKLDMLDYAAVLTDLASPPGNRLEALKGNLRGFHSVRINDQWRIVFRWTDSGHPRLPLKEP
jgi:proteic killer suppression protein